MNVSARIGVLVDVVERLQSLQAWNFTYFFDYYFTSISQSVHYISMRTATGFAAGLAITSSILYCSLTHHKRSRAYQSQLLRQQTLYLDSIVDPRIVPVEDTLRRTGNRDNRKQQWKDWWNTEVQKSVEWCHSFPWYEVQSRIRENMNQMRDNSKRA